jgi:two-component system chemotaxis response regulator CheB
MPEVFTRSFAERLNRLSAIGVSEASHGEQIREGHALIAPGNKHLEIRRRKDTYFTHLSERERVNRHRPSVDVLFSSVAKYAGADGIGIILTGMGADGATGLLEIKRAGGFTLAQDEATSVVFGMPREAIKIGAVNKVLPLYQIAPWLQKNLLR